MLRRSTTSIVRGGMLKTALRAKQPDEGDEELQRSNAEIDAARKKLLYFIPIPALLFLLLLTLLLLWFCRPKGVAPAQGQFLTAVPAENALLETIEAGDVVRCYTADGSIGSIRYVQVAFVTDGSCLLLMDELQLCDFLSLDSYALVPVIRNDKAAVAAALEQQKTWNTPKITLKLSQPELLLESGSRAQLQCSAKITPEDATHPVLCWTSSDETIAAVSSDGTVTATGIGTATITVTCGSTTASCEVRVIICAEALHFDAEGYELAAGQELQLPLVIAPETTTETLQWTSSDVAVAAVDASGAVTAHGAGSAVITVAGARTSASCTVNVSVPAESIVLNSTEQRIAVGGTVQLAAVVMPESTSDKTVTWTSSDEAIATVNADGVVSAIAAGTVTITASCGSASAACSVTIG